MPCIFMRNFPLVMAKSIDPAYAERLYVGIASAAGCPIIEDVQVHIEFGEYWLLRPQGNVVRGYCSLLGGFLVKNIR